MGVSKTAAAQLARRGGTCSTNVLATLQCALCCHWRTCSESSLCRHTGHKPPAGRYSPKTVDLGEKLDLLHLVFRRDASAQTAVIAAKGSVFGWWPFSSF
ncbi:hypothetical protein ACMA5I_13120, partial [Paracoccaceae bacterium GXU_MW_L88]